MSEYRLRTWRVRISRWDIYEVPCVTARTGAEAEERALEIYEETDGYEHVDGGVDSVWVEEVEE